MWRRFLLYGAIGWALEVLMTGASSALRRRDRFATARTYLWMFPIYGGGGLLLERLGRAVVRWPRPARWFVYMKAIYAVEYGSGWLLRRALGACPWDYGRCRLGISGLVRADYLPLWLLVAGSFEPIRDVLCEATAPRPAALPIANPADGSHVEGGDPEGGGSWRGDGAGSEPGVDDAAATDPQIASLTK
jgi:hypothetical protein